MSLNPVTLKRLRRFRAIRRAHFSLILLCALYALSLAAELLCNSRPLYVRYNGKSYFPVVRSYPDDAFTGSGLMTRPDYRKLAASASFRAGPGNRIVFPPIPYGPYESVPAGNIELPDAVQISLAPEPRIGTISVTAAGIVEKPDNAGSFFNTNDAALSGRPLTNLAAVSPAFLGALAERFANQDSEAATLECSRADGARFTMTAATFARRASPPRAVRLTLRDPLSENAARETALLERGRPAALPASGAFASLSDAERDAVLAAAERRFSGPVEPLRLSSGGQALTARFDREAVTFPFRPVRGHPFGLDSSGRDVLARILYGLRTSLTFGFILVIVSTAAGILAGAVQGYFGGLLDLAGQRLIEIWESIPFLYILILMGSVFGRSFLLLIACYACFNWIGMSFYMRAEFLRLRKTAFVESARCLGVPPRRIIFRHILPNALVPVITFFPFSLVGAIGLLAALDYLGFGLPPPTPSWGELLTQAQEHAWAWWLVVYPALALFLVMLLGVFVGEGVRAAFDPRPVSRME